MVVGKPMANRLNRYMKSNPVTKISSEEFVERIVLKKEDAVVTITSTWNGAGQMINSIMEDLALQYPDVHFFSIDYDAYSALAVMYRLEDAPTLLFFRKGTLVDRLSGLTQKSIINEKIHHILNPH